MKQELTFAIGDLLPIVVTLAVAGLVAAFSLQVMSETKDDIGRSDCEADSHYWNTTSQKCEASATNSTQVQGNEASYNASQDAIEGIAKVPEKFGIIATVSIAAVIIGLLLTYFLGRISR